MSGLVAYYTSLIAAWVGAWLVHEQLAARLELAGPRDLVYWTAAKLLVWVLPVLLLTPRVLPGRWPEALALRRVGRGIVVGAACGLVFVAVAVMFDLLFRSFAWPSLTWGFLSAIVVAPLFEELVFRGFVLGWFQRLSVPFWAANAGAAAMFLGLHLPGWYFMGALQPAQSVVAVSIFLVGLIAGFAKRRAGSTWAAVAFHFVNNLYAAFLV